MEDKVVEAILGNLKRVVNDTRREVQVCLEYHASWYVHQVLAWSCDSGNMGKNEFGEEYRTMCERALYIMLRNINFFQLVR